MSSNDTNNGYTSGKMDNSTMILQNNDRYTSVNYKIFRTLFFLMTSVVQVFWYKKFLNYDNNTTFCDTNCDLRMVSLY